MADSLRPVRRAAAKAQLARETLDKAMRDARRDGQSLRAIAEASGLSPEWVRQRTERAS